jgi:hypothetical protein
MKRVQSRTELRDKILLSLGHPYIRVNIADEQFDAAIDNALRTFFKYSPFGSYESHYVYKINATDVNNGYIPIPRNIDAIVEVLHIGSSLSDLSFATAEYQLTRETFMSAQKFTNVSLVDYVTLQQRLYNTQQIIEAPKSFEFVRYQRRLIPNFTIVDGGSIALRCYENVDPEAVDVGYDPTKVISANDLWDDEILLKLSIAEVKKIWGYILKKFGQVVLPGGVTLDGKEIYSEGTMELDALIKDLVFGSPIDFFMG